MLRSDASSGESPKPARQSIGRVIASRLIFVLMLFGFVALGNFLWPIMIGDSSPDSFNAVALGGAVVLGVVALGLIALAFAVLIFEKKRDTSA